MNLFAKSELATSILFSMRTRNLTNRRLGTLTRPSGLGVIRQSGRSGGLGMKQLRGSRGGQEKRCRTAGIFPAIVSVVVVFRFDFPAGAAIDSADKI
jgi:hypothetical protein